MHFRLTHRFRAVFVAASVARVLTATAGESGRRLRGRRVPDHHSGTLSELPAQALWENVVAPDGNCYRLSDGLPLEPARLIESLVAP
jgi:hypothetical protein